MNFLENSTRPQPPTSLCDTRAYESTMQTLYFIYVSPTFTVTLRFKNHVQVRDRRSANGRRTTYLSVPFVWCIPWEVCWGFMYRFVGETASALRSTLPLRLYLCCDVEVQESGSSSWRKISERSKNNVKANKERPADHGVEMCCERKLLGRPT